jgi:hypothetical protein
MICISKKIETYYTIKLHHKFFFEKIVGFLKRYVDFLFSQNDKHAQRLCISIFDFITF